MNKITVETFRTSKGQRRLSMLTGYDFTIAKIIDSAGIDAVLVGDSLGMVMLGYENTLPVTMDDMISHCKSVAKALRHALLVCDLPFMSFQCGISETLHNAGRLLKQGYAEAVKLEGGSEFVPEISALVRAGIPVMGHLGLLPQTVHAMGGYKVQGKTRAVADKLFQDAQAVQNAGAFALVLECVPWKLAEKITNALTIPVIGIGSGNKCDGQVLVWQDMVGMTQRSTPKFVKKFANLEGTLKEAFCAYDQEVKDGKFPDASHAFEMEEE